MPGTVLTSVDRAVKTTDKGHPSGAFMLRHKMNNEQDSKYSMSENDRLLQDCSRAEVVTRFMCTCSRIETDGKKRANLRGEGALNGLFSPAKIILGLQYLRALYILLILVPKKSLVAA